LEEQEDLQYGSHSSGSQGLDSCGNLEGVGSCEDQDPCYSSEALVQAAVHMDCYDFADDDDCENCNYYYAYDYDYYFDCAEVDVGFDV
jgi:hypothetical protein